MLALDFKASRGRSRFGWIDGIKGALSKRGLRLGRARVCVSEMNREILLRRYFDEFLYFLVINAYGVFDR